MAEPASARQPSPETHPEPEHEPEPGSYNAEPQVNLSTVGDIWKDLFQAHWIGLSVFFTLLVLYNIIQLVRTFKRKRLANRSYILSVQLLVILLGITRTLALCFSPYGLTNNVNAIPQVIPRLLFGLGFPFLFSGFTFVHKMFLKVSKVQIFTSKNTLTARAMFVILILHLLAVFTAEVVTGYIKGTRFLLVICGCYYFIGFTAVSLSLLYSGSKIIRRTRQVQDSLNNFQLRNSGNDPEQQPTSRVQRRTTNAGVKVLRITVTAVVFGLLCSLLYIYTLVWVFRYVLGDTSSPSPWRWLVITTLIRIFELVLAVVMSYAVCHTYQESRNPSHVSSTQ